AGAGPGVEQAPPRREPRGDGVDRPRQLGGGRRGGGGDGGVLRPDQPHRPGGGQQGDRAARRPPVEVAPGVVAHRSTGTRRGRPSWPPFTSRSAITGPSEVAMQPSTKTHSSGPKRTM